MKKISHEELQEYLNEIISCDAFVLHVSNKEGRKSCYYIPYMMNDALECYLILRNGYMTGQYDSELEVEMTAEAVETEDGTAVIFRQGTTNVFMIWFEDAFRKLQCYRYDQIGHFWMEGQEQWRRLVYIIGTIHDKYNYMGESVCNEKELELLPLMEFAPFRYFSPIHESLDEYYVNSQDGLECMKALAAEAEDYFLLRLLKQYHLKSIQKILNPLIVKAMMKPGRNRLYQLLFEKVRDASLPYPDRVYEDGIEEMIQEERRLAKRVLSELGFSGTYPLFQKENVQILAMEEHPFTILESEHYNFKIQYMVSEMSSPKSDADRLLNSGFFLKKGNRGWIARNLKELSPLAEKKKK